MPEAGKTEDVGSIPPGKFDVYVRLEANNDIDITLYDVEDQSKFREGTAIVAWCGTSNCNKGVLGMQSGKETATYSRAGISDMTIEYSGYNGQNNDPGNEYIRIFGETSTVLMMRAYAFKSGKAKVSYSWGRSQDLCCMGLKACGGSFTQDVATSAILEVGEIPAGKLDVEITLTETNRQDVDVQLYDLSSTGDFEEGTAIIAWCGTRGCNLGLLNGADYEETQYPLDDPDAPVYAYSGYNGVTHQGDESITITGELDRPLMMKVYGFKSGTATVVYSYWNPTDFSAMTDSPTPATATIDPPPFVFDPAIGTGTPTVEFGT